MLWFTNLPTLVIHSTRFKSTCSKIDSKWRTNYCFFKKNVPNLHQFWRIFWSSHQQSPTTVTFDSPFLSLFEPLIQRRAMISIGAARRTETYFTSIYPGPKSRVICLLCSVGMTGGRGRGDYSCHSKTAVASQSKEEADYLRERMTANKTPSWQILLPVEQTQNTSTSKAQTVVNVFCCSFFKMGVTVFKGRFKRIAFCPLVLPHIFRIENYFSYSKFGEQ